MRSTKKTLLCAAAILSVAAVTFYLTRPGEQRLVLLGTTYSAQITALHHDVTNRWKRPIVPIEVSSGDDQLELTTTNILLRLKRGAAEKTVAHELMHGILHSEGFPRVGCISTSEFAMKLHPLIDAFPDHLIINDRVRALGFEPLTYKTAATFRSLLTLNYPEDKQGQAIFTTLMLCQLVKFHYYFGDPSAQNELLARFPGVVSYWRAWVPYLERAVSEKSQESVWAAAVAYFHIADRICADFGIADRCSELFVCNPMPLTPAECDRPAVEFLDLRIEGQQDGSVLEKTFFRRDGIMVNVNSLRPKVAGLDEEFWKKYMAGIMPPSTSMREFCNAHDIGIFVLTNRRSQF